MIERGFVDLYMGVCRDLDLDENERRLLWLAIVNEIERVEARFDDPANATEEQILAVCEELQVPTFRTLGACIRSKREKDSRAWPAELNKGAPLRRPGGVTNADRLRVAEVANEFLP